MLCRPKRPCTIHTRTGRASTAAVASNVVPAKEAIQHLQREAGVLGMTSLLGVVRARDAFTMTPTRHAAWHLTGGSVCVQKFQPLYGCRLYFDMLLMGNVLPRK